MQRVYRFGLIFGIIGAISLLLFFGWWVLFIRAGSFSDDRHDFDVSRSGSVLIFDVMDKSSKNDILCILDRRSQQIRRITIREGSVEEVRLLSENEAVVAIRDKPLYDSDIYLYLLDLRSGKLQRLTKSSRVWEKEIVPISSDKFIFRQYQVKTRLTPFGWDTYGLLDQEFLVDTSQQRITPIHLENTSYLKLEQVLSDKRKVVLSFDFGDSKKWFLGNLDKQIDELNPKIVRKQPIGTVSSMACLGNDGRLVYYVIQNKASGLHEIYQKDLLHQQAKKIATIRHPVVRLRWARGRLFLMTNSASPALWEIAPDGNLRKLVDIYTLQD